MAYEQKPNSGSLWPNDRKEKDTHPDLTGTVDINGAAYYISGWPRVSQKDGREYIHVAFKPKEQQAGAGGGTPAPAGGLSKWSRPVVQHATGQNPPAQETAAPKPTLPDEEVPF
jgi:hypothetical protein